MAIPVGQRLGFVIGGQVAATSSGWRGAFLVVVIPGLILGALCFFMKEPPRTQAQASQKHGLREYGRIFLRIWKVPSFRYNTIAMTSSTFILGGVAAFAPLYIFEREAKFQFTEESLQKLADKKASDGTPVVGSETIDKLRPLIGDRAYNSTELRDTLGSVLTKQEIERYNESIYEALPHRDSIKLETINLTFRRDRHRFGAIRHITWRRARRSIAGSHPGRLFPRGGGRLHRGLPLLSGDALRAVPLCVGVHVPGRVRPLL